MSRSEMTDTEMEAIMDDIVEGLFAVCVTLGMIHSNEKSWKFVYSLTKKWRSPFILTIF